MERLGEGSKPSSHESDPLYVQVKSDDARTNFTSSNLFPNVPQPATHATGAMPSFTSAPDFSQLVSTPPMQVYYSLSLWCSQVYRCARNYGVGC